MQRLFKRLFIFVIVFGFANYVFALTKDYYPNYKIKDSWDEIVKTLSFVESYKNTGKDVPIEYFNTLYTNFKVAFQYFPKNPADYTIVYNQCLITTKDLAKKYNYDDFLRFREVCFDPINKIIKEIDRNYTVKAQIDVKNTSGAAPLTVTFDGRKSQDPSNDTIPTNNYYWYFKDNNGNDVSIGKGPVVNYTFVEPGSYKIHLTVRSASFEDKGIFDGEAVQSIEVDPKAAVLSVYAGGKRLVDDYNTKIGTEQAKRGVLIDGSGTAPIGGRKLVEHRWNIVGSDNGYSFGKRGDGSPKSFTIQFPAKGEYTVELWIKDNEGNEMSKKYTLVVSDPVANIKVKPETSGDTSTKYYFDASTSYSVQSRIKLYKWVIYGPSGQVIDNYESKNFERKFTVPGNYSVKLTIVDDLGVSSDDYFKFYVDSTAPVAQYIATPLYKWKYPSQFMFDATPSYDVDQMNGADTLKYEWKFSNSENVKVEKTMEDGKKVFVSFNQPGKYQVTLEVSDKRGKITEQQKEIEVKSSLRPEIYTDKMAGIWGEPMRFAVKSNKTIAYYEWDFGDGKRESSNKDSISHTYDKAGFYIMKLKAKTPSGDENELTHNVYIGQKGSPIPVHAVKTSQDVTLTPTDICVIRDGNDRTDKKAYSVDRGQQLIIDGSMSLNSQGSSADTKVSYKPQNDDILTKSPLSYKFDELGCQYIDISVEDKQNSKTAKDRVYFKVKNALPEIKNVTISFPQYGNEVGVGLNQANKNKDVYQIEYDPLIVRVSAMGTQDTDGFISHYIWYYYKTDDPERLLEVKITPANIPYAIFSLPRVPGEFSFGVKVMDNDGGETKSEDILGKGPVVFFKAEGSVDIPLVTLSLDNVNAKVGEEVEFKVVSRILSNRADFASNRIIKYDFDGDGTYDLTTKKPIIKHIYTKTGRYKPKVKVIYRGYAGIGYGDLIQVEKGLKAGVLYDSYGKIALVRDISFGDISSRLFCMDIKNCNTNKQYKVEDKDYFSFEYPSFGKKIGTMDINDEYGNEANEKLSFDLKEPSKDRDFVLMSLPKPEEKDGNLSIDVGGSLDNSVLFYPIYSLTGECYIDLDITVDSDNDGNPEGDKDLQCNKMKMYNYNPVTSSTISRIYYIAKDGKKMTRDLTVNFLDIDYNLPDKYKKVYGEIGTLIEQLKDVKDENVRYLKTLLVNLRKSLGDDTERDSLVLQINDWLETNTLETLKGIDPKIIDNVNKIIDEIADGAVKAAMTSSEYDIAKADILNFMPESTRDKVKDLFTKIEFASGDANVIKDSLQEILNIAGEQYKNGAIDETDLNVVLNDVCTIMKYYNIESAKCGNVPAQPENAKGTLLGTIFKVVLWIIAILVVGFILIVVVFAIKAKRQQQRDAISESDIIEPTPENETSEPQPQEPEEKKDESQT